MKTKLLSLLEVLMKLTPSTYESDPLAVWGLS